MKKKNKRKPLKKLRESGYTAEELKRARDLWLLVSGSEQKQKPQVVQHGELWKSCEGQTLLSPQ